MSKELYPYQGDCHESVISKYDAGVLKQLIVLFTGAGKTFLLIKLLERMGFKRVLWLSFQEELVSQTAMAFIHDKFDESFYSHVKEVGFLDYVKDGSSRFAAKGFSIGCIKGDIFKPDANVVMGSVMTVARRLDRLPEDYFDCIICDEAHLFGSLTAVNTINYFKPKLLLGATATPTRQDGMMLGDIFDEITFEYGLDRGVKTGFCTELDAIRVKTNVSLDKIKTLAGDLNQKELSSEINTLARNQLIVDSWKKYAKGRQTIAFCVNIRHAIDLAEVFRMNDVNSVAVSSDEELTPDRSENISAFKEGKFDVITNVGILVAGFDHKNIGCAIMACPTKSLTKYLQSIGRAARLKTPDYVVQFGQNAIILDITDVTSKHNLINAWELDKKKPIEDRTFTSAENKKILLDERAKKIATIENEIQKDSRVKLISLPVAVLSNSIRMREPATVAQLRVVESLGYDVTNSTYTMKMCNEIISALPAGKDKLEYLRSKGYDVSKGATNGQFSTIEWKMKAKYKR